MQRDPRQHEAFFVQFTIQRLGNLIYILHILALAVLTSSSGAPAILSGLRYFFESAKFFQCLDECSFGVRSGKCRKFFLQMAWEHYGSWCFLQQAPKIGKKFSKNVELLGTAPSYIVIVLTPRKRDIP